MGHVIALFAVLVRLFRPTNGTHTSPFGYLRELAGEFRRVRSRRVRKFAETIPAADGRTGLNRTGSAPGVLVRVPADYVPVVDPAAVAEPADIVRGFYRAHEARTERHRADRTRLGVAVLREIATENRAQVSA